MDRRHLQLLLGGAALASSLSLASQESPRSTVFRPDRNSVRVYALPDWYRDAKLGIFIHGGLYSVPAWATSHGEVGKVNWNMWFYQNPYAELCLNALCRKGSPTYQQQIDTCGANFDYCQFAEAFNEKNHTSQPGKWASLFRKTGAKYVVLTPKLHDGFRLWPSGLVNPHADGRILSARGDRVGELTSAVRGPASRMSPNYSGGLDWTFSSFGPGDQPPRFRLVID